MTPTLTRQLDAAIAELNAIEPRVQAIADLLVADERHHCESCGQPEPLPENIETASHVLVELSMRVDELRGLLLRERNANDERRAA